MRWARGLVMAIVLPGLLFCAVAVARRGLCLEAYQWEAGVGYRPVPETCLPEERASLLGAAGFYARSVGGMLTGRPGRSREDAGRSLLSLLMLRGSRSVVILGVASGVLLGLTAAAAAVGRLLHRVRHRPWARKLQTLGRAAGPLAPPGGLPLPLAGLLIFIVVMRVLPAGSAFDYDKAALLWAGVSLALADGAAMVLFVGLGQALDQERRRPYAEALHLWGRDPGPAVRHASRRVRAAQLRGAALALLGGLLVVENVFSVNGLGETLRDLVVDRQGLDPLLLAGVLVVFSLFVLAVEWLPLEALLGGKP